MAAPVPVDALIVGGGVQGLRLLEGVRERGYSCALVTVVGETSGRGDSV